MACNLHPSQHRCACSAQYVHDSCCVGCLVVVQVGGAGAKRKCRTCLLQMRKWLGAVPGRLHRQAHAQHKGAERSPVASILPDSTQLDQLAGASGRSSMVEIMPTPTCKPLTPASMRRNLRLVRQTVVTNASSPHYMWLSFLLIGHIHVFPFFPLDLLTSHGPTDRQPRAQAPQPAVPRVDFQVIIRYPVENQSTTCPAHTPAAAAVPASRAPC